MVRVLVVDDSAVAREYLAYLLGRDPDIQVVGTATDGVRGVAEAGRLRPDVIVMDVHMPGMDGYQATRHIMESVPTPIVMASASRDQNEVAMTFEALEAGALVVVDKPPSEDHPSHARSRRRLLEAVKLMSEVKVIRRRPQTALGGEPRPRTAVATAEEPVRVVAIGASTGGPPVLSQLLADLPPTLAAPIVIVQHTTPGFMKGLADWLASRTGLPVKLGESGEMLRPGTVYVAPDGAQTRLTRGGRIHLGAAARDGSFCPSVNVLFDSVAVSYGPAALGVLLTGMGKDGATGLLRMKEAGAMTVAQDEESSVVFGMPAEAIALGAVRHIVPPDRIAALIRSLAGAV